MLKVDGFEWDKGNSSKNETKHGLGREAIEAFFRQSGLLVAPDPKHSASEDRLLAIGRGPGGRPMAAVFTLRPKDGLVLIRVISARFMHAKEARRYEQAFAQTEE